MGARTTVPLCLSRIGRSACKFNARVGVVGVRIGKGGCFSYFTWLMKRPMVPISFPDPLRGKQIVVRPFYKSHRKGFRFLLYLPLPPNAPASKPSASNTSPSPSFSQASDLACCHGQGRHVAPCNITGAMLEARVKGGLLRPVTDERALEWIVPPANDREPNPPPGYVVCFLSFLD